MAGIEAAGEEMLKIRTLRHNKHPLIFGNLGVSLQSGNKYFYPAFTAGAESGSTLYG